MQFTPFSDRRDAGQKLARELPTNHANSDLVVLGLPRGGVPVAAPVAAALGAPLDVLVVRKLGLPDQPELAMGAIAGVGGQVEVIRNSHIIEQARVSEADFNEVLQTETSELQRRESIYRQGSEPVNVQGQAVVLIDDGVATGSTAMAAIAALRRQKPKHILFAAPVGSAQGCADLREQADAVLCLSQPEPFHGVGQGYANFQPPTDTEVHAALNPRN